MAHYGEHDPRVTPGQSQEGQVTSYIEQHTSRLPSAIFLGAAGAAVAGALILKLNGKGENANFVGQWVGPFLLLGIYNKLVKQRGSEATRRESTPQQFSQAA
jgi:uncharacterized membrane protein YeaQ/YmgE (transglycosylase-associated protein family)